MKKIILVCVLTSSSFAEVSFDDVYYENKVEDRRTYSFQLNYGKANFADLIGERNPFGETELQMNEDPQMISGSFYSSFSGLSSLGLVGNVSYFWAQQSNEFYYLTDQESSRRDNSGGPDTGKRKIQAATFTLGLRFEMGAGSSSFVPFLGGGFGGAVYRDNISRGDRQASPPDVKSDKPWDKPIGYAEAGLYMGLIGIFDSTSQAKDGFFGHKNGENGGLVLKVGYQNDFDGGGYDMSGLYYSLGLSVRTDS